MTQSAKIKKEFSSAKNSLFTDEKIVKDAFKFSIKYSLIVEEYIHRALVGKKKTFVIASAGSFSRRELSPFSDIDVMFIFREFKGHEEIIEEIIGLMWDCGIEVSHTIRDFSDIDRFLEDDLHSYTQFFETRFILGDEKIYNSWNKKVVSSIGEEDKQRLIYQYFEDINSRHRKHGDSPKVLEPNVKLSAGGLRDLHSVEWIYSLKNNLILSNQSEVTQTESFVRRIKKEKIVNPIAAARILNSYKNLLYVRNLLHLQNQRKCDRFEFKDQEKISSNLKSGKESWHEFMRDYFNSTNIIHRFSKTILKRFDEQISNPVSDYLSINLDDDYQLKGNVIFLSDDKDLSLPDILRAFYYRGKNGARFNQMLRSQIIESIFEMEESEELETISSVFFREILNLPSNVGNTLYVMNELGVLGAYLPEFREMVGFFQPGVYHCYTADEHTLIALINLENLSEKENYLSNILGTIERKDLLYLAVLLHDIAKPISVSGHEIIGAEVARSIMERLGYDDDDVEIVQFLVRFHLAMEQVAFRRNISDSSTLDNFSKLFKSSDLLDMLYLVTYADLSAVSPVVWTNWKSDLLYQLYRKTRSMLDDKLSGEDLLYSDVYQALKENGMGDDTALKSHIESINDVGYFQHFSQEEINQHVSEIESGVNISVFFKQESGFSNITLIAKDSPSLLSRLCGALSINDLNIHDAKIFTRRDGIVIDSFNVTDYRTNKIVDEERYSKIENDLRLVIKKELQIDDEFLKVKSKWWRIETKIFKRKGKIKVEFEDHDKYTIIDVFSPDRIGLLYQITKKMNELGLSIYFAKIATKSDDVVDAFYVLDREGKKLTENSYTLITHELLEVIEEK